MHDFGDSVLPRDISCYIGMVFKFATDVRYKGTPPDFLCKGIK